MTNSDKDFLLYFLNDCCDRIKVYEIQDGDMLIYKQRLSLSHDYEEWYVSTDFEITKDGLFIFSDRKINTINDIRDTKTYGFGILIRLINDEHFYIFKINEKGKLLLEINNGV